MKAICYLRFSSEGQSDGSSIDRQKEHVEGYCKRNGLEIVQTLEDPGFSAYKGNHLAEGKLGQFFKDADKGLYRGYALVIEHLDRLSRQGIKATFDLIERLLNADVELHETQNGRVYHSLDDLGVAIVDGHAAKLYSKKLSERVTKGWKDAKRAASPDRIVHGNVPFWLTVNEGKMQVIPEKVADVREAFRLAALGNGAYKISRALGGRIPFSTLGAVLRNRAVLGEYQPCKFDEKGKRVPDGDVVDKYFPKIISVSEFNAARENISKRFRSGNRRGSGAKNLFGGIVFDVTSEPARGLRLNGNGKGYLESAFDPHRKSHRVRIDKFESLFLDFLQHQVDWKAVAGHSESAEYKQAVAQLEAVLTELDRTHRLIEKRTADMEDPDLDSATVKVFASQIARAEGRITNLEEQKSQLQGTVDSLRATSEALYHYEELIPLISALGSTEMRLRLRAEIAKMIQRIEFDFSGTHRMPIVVSVQFVNGARLHGAVALGK